MNGFERRKEQKKNNILEASLDLFLNRGIQNVTVSEIAKAAHVSQVTIYNYFGSKDELVQQVFKYYLNKEWIEYSQLLDSNLSFHDKVKKITFEKGAVASQINQDFFSHFMKEYTSLNSYIEAFYQDKVLPRFIELFNEGKEQGIIDPALSNEAILVYLQMFKEYIERNDVAETILPLTEELTKLFFYGIGGRQP